MPRPNIRMSVDETAGQVRTKLLSGHTAGLEFHIDHSANRVKRPGSAGKPPPRIEVDHGNIAAGGNFTSRPIGVHAAARNCITLLAWDATAAPRTLADITCIRCTIDA